MVGRKVVFRPPIFRCFVSFRGVFTIPKTNRNQKKTSPRSWRSSIPYGRQDQRSPSWERSPKEGELWLFLGCLSNFFQWLSDFQLGDQKVTNWITWYCLSIVEVGAFSTAVANLFQQDYGVKTPDINKTVTTCHNFLVRVCFRLF